ncbi:MAG: poly-gamma-glutamate system protein [Deltaproteobacteria bacterium]|jgi:poly-gamma-glutamate system protein|nr:poly-gamma-glutamate system protein [Deltaproteobacteria bacterium]
MKKIYWRPSGVSRSMMLMMSALAIVGMIAVESFKTKNRQRMYDEKLKAAQLMSQSMSALAERRAAVAGHIDLEDDPTRSGMIGALMSDITSTSGHLQAKQTTVNPNWAAVMVDLYRRAKLKAGDTIAVGLSGSFPALNLATYAAAEAMELKVVSITGVSSSMWGANLPEFTWLDMERHLLDRKILRTRSVAATLGGVGDNARGVSPKGRALLKAAVERSGLPLITSKSEDEGLEERMEIYRRSANGAEIKAYVNVGGNTLSVGSLVGKRLYSEGLNLHPSAGALSVDCVMTRFAKEDIPVIHMIRVDQLAERYGLPLAPRVMPKAGEGTIFLKAEYNISLVVGVIAALLGLLYVFMKSDVGYRIFHSGDLKEGAKPPAPMV